MSDPGDEMLSIREVCVFFGGKEKPLDKSTIYEWVRTGKLPQSIPMGAQLRRWKKSDCQQLLDVMAAQRARK